MDIRKKQNTSYIALLAAVGSALSGDPYALSEKKTRFILQKVGGDAVVAAAERPAPRFRWRRLAHNLTCNKIGLANALFEEVFAAAGAWRAASAISPIPWA